MRLMLIKVLLFLYNKNKMKKKINLQSKVVLLMKPSIPYTMFTTVPLSGKQANVTFHTTNNYFPIDHASNIFRKI